MYHANSLIAPGYVCRRLRQLFGCAEKMADHIGQLRGRGDGPADCRLGHPPRAVVTHPVPPVRIWSPRCNRPKELLPVTAPIRFPYPQVQLTARPSVGGGVAELLLGQVPCRPVRRLGAFGDSEAEKEAREVAHAGLLEAQALRGVPKIQHSGCVEGKQAL